MTKKSYWLLNLKVNKKIKFKLFKKGIWTFWTNTQMIKVNEIRYERLSFFL